MAKNPENSDPAEGSREIIERELDRRKNRLRSAERGEASIATPGGLTTPSEPGASPGGGAKKRPSGEKRTK